MGHCQGDPENYNCEARVKAIIVSQISVVCSFFQSNDSKQYGIPLFYYWLGA